MSKTTFKLTAIILLIFCGLKLPANAQTSSGKNFILPKSFKINDDYLPPLDLKPEPKQNKTTSTNPPSQTTQTKNTIPVVNKQPTATITTTPAPNDGSKTKTVQTNPVTINTANKTNNSTSLSNLIKVYDSSYENTMKSTIISLAAMGISPDSYNTDKGQILAKLPSGQGIFILLVPLGDNSTTVRITPTDGNYNIPLNTVNAIFSDINSNLTDN